MKKLFFVLAALMTVPALYAADDTPIQNVCDSLSLGATPVIELVPAYIDESNWYGNPHTMAKDSSTFKRHETYESLTINISNQQYLEVPISITAGCQSTPMTEVGYAKWTINRTWEKTTADDVETYIYDIRSLKTDGHDSSNTYNLLAFVPGNIPQDYSFESHQLLYSVTFEFAFEWWFASASYKPTPSTISYRSSRGNDSLKVVQTALAKFPDTLNTARLQVIKVVLVDSRKLPEPESSSSVVSSSSVEESSSSIVPVSSSSEEKSSSSNAPVSSSSEEKSSSSEAPTSSADVESSSSEVVGPESSADEESSSSEAVGPESSADVESSSSAEPATSSSGKQEVSSSSAEPESSSSEGTTRLVTMPNRDGSVRMVQVRTLDGSIVKNSGNLAPGVYYVKYSNGKWSKMAVLPR